MPSVARISPETLSIGELSRRTGVNVETIRYYERVKMLPAPPFWKVEACRRPDFMRCRRVEPRGSVSDPRTAGIGPELPALRCREAATLPHRNTAITISLPVPAQMHLN
jgi:hypothetical protein